MSHFKVLVKSPLIKKLEDYQVLNQDWISSQKAIDKFIDSIRNIQQTQYRITEYKEDEAFRYTSSVVTSLEMAQLLGKQSVEIERNLRWLHPLFFRLKSIIDRLTKLLPKPVEPPINVPQKKTSKEVSQKDEHFDILNVMHLDSLQVTTWLSIAVRYYQSCYDLQHEALKNLPISSLTNFDVSERLSLQQSFDLTALYNSKQNVDHEITQWLRASRLAYQIETNS